jgi:3-oxoacyl-[acyl-carrier-protein] synthase-3
LVSPAPAHGARLIGLGSSQPDRLVSAGDLGRPFGKSADWVQTRTGIRSLRRVESGVELIELACKAAVGALDDAGITADRLDLVIVANCSSTEREQPLAASLVDRLGARCAHFDLNAACSGFCYALSTADALIRVGSTEHVLIVAAETMSSIVDENDLATSIVFGDGAGAVVVGRADSLSGRIGPAVWGSDGKRSELIEFDRDHGRFLRMRGQEVFRWAVDSVPDIARAACQRAGVAMRDIDVFVPHQANLRIIDAVVRRLALRPDVLVATDITESGNTSAASIPIALDRLRNAGQLPSNGLALLAGFGAGLAHAAQVVRLP